MNSKRSPWYYTIILACILVVMGMHITHRENTIDILESNLKSLQHSSDSITNHNSVLRLSKTELKNSSDSIIAVLRHSLDSIGVQYRKVKNVSYIRSNVVKTDTIVFRDTIFQKDVALDTIIQDKWSKIELSLKYPDTVKVKPSFVSEKHVIFSHKRETINPPSNIFFIRWFQRKHTIVEVRVIDKNPYITEEENRFIDIIK